uniref:Fibronectin type III domain-containing protein n=1 Tax=Candidatus Kentrum eta TaxID=2126337 RepID=A0A450V9C8_9GAMM|nr:MAG: hypothetical protein BECKH772B_GA0070898_102092 [Candidatus Kentron sp. H]VFK01401.1 MAG: hypothetical protein BECKH772A_GA0070896_102261 [Candidatus Kentron sp. H]VFK04787.1 MAG: hypothetical protein BECKH772C_GA0070978_102072 [Candidatus Kentron sp. H]
MARFPIEEGKIFLLGQRMSTGLKTNSDIYPAPPINPLDLDEILAAYSADKDAAVAAQSTAERATVKKQASLQTLTDTIKKNLRYAEMIVDFDDAKLKAIGWGGRKERTPLAAPGQAPTLVSVEQGDDWIRLAWKKPRDGGKPATYEIRRREWEYGVVAMNKAGEGPISNTVMAVL